MKTSGFKSGDKIIYKMGIRDSASQEYIFRITVGRIADGRIYGDLHRFTDGIWKSRMEINVKEDSFKTYRKVCEDPLAKKEEYENLWL